MSSEFPKIEQLKNVEIVGATAEDVAEILNVQYLAARANYPDGEIGITAEDIDEDYKGALTEESIAQQTEEWRSRPENLDQKYMTARVDGKLVGFCIVNRLSDKNQIMGFYILPSFQRQGIGHRLWEQAEVFLDPTKVTTVMVLPYNSLARKFYESLGFRETGEVANNGVGQTMASGAIMPAPIELKREAKVLDV